MRGGVWNSSHHLLSVQWGCVEWDRIYTDLPSRLLKVRVKDRMVVETADFARRCVAPDGLQEEIDQLVAATSKGRAFVRYDFSYGTGIF